MARREGSLLYTGNIEMITITLSHLYYSLECS
jgi:hypothetical protein